MVHGKSTTQTLEVIDNTTNDEKFIQQPNTLNISGISPFSLINFLTKVCHRTPVLTQDTSYANTAHAIGEERIEIR